MNVYARTAAAAQARSACPRAVKKKDGGGRRWQHHGAPSSRPTSRKEEPTCGASQTGVIIHADGPVIGPVSPAPSGRSMPTPGLSLPRGRSTR